MLTSLYFKNIDVVFWSRAKSSVDLPSIFQVHNMSDATATAAISEISFELIFVLTIKNLRNLFSIRDFFDISRILYPVNI